MRITELIVKIKEGDSNALVELIERFTPLIRKYNRNTHIEDLESSLVEHLITAISYMPVREEGQNINYITTLLKNKFFSEIKKIHSLKKKEILQDTPLTDDYSINNDYSNIYFLELISVLDIKKRLIILLRYWYGYSDIEISFMLNVSRQTINTKLRQAYKTIKTSYLKEKKIS